MAALYSIIIPVYNSEATLPELCERLCTMYSSMDAGLQIIMVNDGSADQSWSCISALCSRYPSIVTGINLLRNYGQHKALLCGLQHCTGDFAVTIDDDLQYHPEDIAALIATQAEHQADVVYGIHARKKHSAVRNAGSKVVATIFEKYAHMPQKGSSFKLISRHVIDQIKGYNHPYVFLDEVIGWYSRQTSYVTVRHENRKAGTSGYSSLQLLRYSMQIILSYTTLPLRLITWLGLLAFFVCLGIIIYFIYMKYTYGAELGFTALIVSIFMSTGLILFCIGIIGEYLSRLFIIQTDKPIFIVKEIVS
ncbi:MAG: glycosyltransferase family 2 protein [Bacteroidetes bacterium]|nr:glycosyltransferase family 2 protein [Bacteroidota bacterium]